MINKTLAGIVASLPLVFGACNGNNNVEIKDYDIKESSVKELVVPSNCKRILNILYRQGTYQVACENKDGNYALYSRDNLQKGWYEQKVVIANGGK